MSFKRSIPLLYFLVVFTFGTLSLSYGQNNIYFDHITTDNGLSQSDVNSIYQDNQGFMWFATHEGLNKYDGYNFTVYNPGFNVSNSISSNLIYALTGSDDGNLWVGTTGNGLNYFNKSLEKFMLFEHNDKDPHSLKNNQISSLLKDKKDRLWVGSLDGIDLLDLKNGLKTIKFQHFKLNQNNIFQQRGNNAVHNIFEDKQGNIWVGGNLGLYKLSIDQNGNYYFNHVSRLIKLGNRSVRSINQDIFGRLIIGTNNGLFILKAGKGTNWVERIGDGFINTILAEEGRIWAGTNNGLLYLENHVANANPVLKRTFVYDPMNPNSISKNIITSIYKDRTGIIWVGTNGGGVNKFDPARKDFKHVKKNLNPNSLSYDKIRSMFEDSNGTLWIGTEGGGLNMLTKNKDDSTYSEFVNYTTLTKPFTIIEVERNNKKILLIGGGDIPGVYQLDITDPNKIKESNIKSFYKISGNVFSLLEDSNKNLWVGTYNRGISRWLYDESTNDYKKDILAHDITDTLSVSNNIIRNIFEDSKGNIWFATGKGLCKLSPDQITKKKPKFDIYTNRPSDNKSISHNYNLEIFESRNGDIWIGTLGGGLNKFVPASSPEEADRFISYKIKDGLPNNVIKGILEDEEGHLWISTNKGISKFNPDLGTFKNYDLNDGLQSNEFQELARLKRQNGELLFGGINGFNAFYPKNIENNIYPAETVITKFSISNKPVQIGKEINGRTILNKTVNNTDKIVLKYNENNFSFEFAALHFASPQKNNFAYMLEGFDKSWIFTNPNKRFATYTNLPHKTYTLKVKTSNNDGLWDSSPSEIKIKITPPFWKTPIAYFLYILMVLGLLFLFRRFTIIRTTKKHQLEIEHFENEKNEELQKIKLEFFTNISHELRTPLTLINAPLKYLQKQGDKLEKSVLQEQYSLMQKNCDYLLRLVNQLLDFRKINQGKTRLVMRKSNIIQFIKEASEPFQFLAHKNNIKLIIDSENKSLSTWFDHDAIEKIINNLLSNAFNYTEVGGTISIHISKSSDIGQTPNQHRSKHVVIQVKDTGIGIESSRLKNIFERFHTEKNQTIKISKGVGIGLSFVNDIVKLHQGSIEVSSELNKGSIFTVKLPIEKLAYEGVPEIICKDSTDSDFRTRTSETDSLAISINDEIEDLDIDKSRSKNLVLLIVDDNADIRSFLKLALKDKYVIYEAENGKIGLDIATKVLPNLILTDVLMPEMDGIELCKHVKTQQETSHIPVVMLTAKLSQESELESLKTGADDYIRKPFDVELLELKIKNIIQHRNKLRTKFNKEIAFKPKDVTVTTLDEQFLQQAVEIVEKHMMNTDFNVEMLVKEMGLSRSNLYLKFKEITGLSSSEFIRNIRLKRAVQLFQKSDYSVKEIMYMTGFNTASYFAKCFKKQFGIIPSEYVKRQANKKSNEQIP
ncbi:hybrid sensor histidine kinase/response regulator transcription factor [uncultured Algibacter sp.]|uniref:hybrid sensor histidine kinase/response regulator transcription factor n=1 Tax=uncultured Algibacter sp. TaxID=298659 RepID=UPI0026349B7E|nr:hybrid sensor histidine kinase/response regulator transcription factor [uncultured Algibacter sp.]